MNSTRATFCPKIFLDTPRIFYSRKNTDWKLKLTLARELSEMRLHLPSSLLYTVVANLQELLYRYIPKKLRGVWMRSCSRLRGILLRKEGAEIVIAQGWDPPINGEYKLLWETYFLPPQANRDKIENFVRGGSNIWIRQMERYGNCAWRIAVRGSASVQCLRKMYPEFSDKIVDLPFVQPEYNIISESEIESKHSKDDVEIVFVGREAKRKGLEYLLCALQMIRQSGIRNFSFTIISSMSDGKIPLPNVPWISYYKELPHSEVMTILRRAQIFAMPSKFESYGLAYLEAMASGCVVVLRNQDPQREFVAAGEAGVCVDENSIESIKEGLSELITKRDTRMRLAQSALQRYKCCFSQEVIRKRWIECLLGL